MTAAVASKSCDITVMLLLLSDINPRVSFPIVLYLRFLLSFFLFRSKIWKKNFQSPIVSNVVNLFHLFFFSYQQ